MLGYYLTDYTFLDNLNFLVPRLFTLLTIYGSSSHLSSAHDIVRKYLGISNYLTIVSTSFKNFFQYADVPLTELIHENTLFLATNLSIVPLKLLLNHSAVRVPGLILCLANFLMNVSGAAHIQTWQKYIICI